MTGELLDLVVIGGGPAGIFAAITCCECRPNSRIIVLEKDAGFLNKLRLSGGGRCNLTNAAPDLSSFTEAYPRGSHLLKALLNQFSPRQTMHWFIQHGVQLKTEEGNRVFPLSDSALTVVNCLLDEAERKRIILRDLTEVTQISPAAGSSGEFSIRLAGQTEIYCKRILIATGGNRKGFELLSQLNIPLIPPVPSLFSLSIADERLQDLSGISFEARLSLPDYKISISGPVLITHWGLSGPGVLKISSLAARNLAKDQYRAALEINFLQNLNQDQVYSRLLEFKSAKPDKKLSFLPFKEIPQRLWQKIIQSAGISADGLWRDISKNALNRLAQELTHAVFQIDGKGSFKDEFVTCGGVDLKAVQWKTLESKDIPGLFFAGEVLDIDGFTGGYNLQCAWTTGYQAGKTIAEGLGKLITEIPNPI